MKILQRIANMTNEEVIAEIKKVMGELELARRSGADIGDLKSYLEYLYERKYS